MMLPFLESFDAEATPDSPAMVPESELETARQEGRDEGYAAGWQAAADAAEQDRARITAELAAAVSELGFTYREAHAHVMRGIEPLLHELLHAVLPALLTRSLSHSVCDELMALAEAGAEHPVLVATFPEEVEALRSALPQDASLPVRVVGDPALTPGQAALKLGQSERLVDLSGVLARLADALDAVSDLNERTLAHA